MAATHFCTYCDFYSRRWDGKREPGSTVFTGTRAEVVAHADAHPIGDPEDMAMPLSDRAPYEGEEAEKWTDAEAQRFTRTAQYILRTHGPHSDQIARDNCAACAVNTYTATEGPNYAGWLRLYIQARKPVPRKHYDAEMAMGERENELYHKAILRDIATYGIKFEGEQ